MGDASMAKQIQEMGEEIKIARQSKDPLVLKKTLDKYDNVAFNVMLEYARRKSKLEDCLSDIETVLKKNEISNLLVPKMIELKESVINYINECNVVYNEVNTALKKVIGLQQEYNLTDAPTE